MSFANDVKNDLCRQEVAGTCCQMAELFGLLRVSGAVSITARGLGLNFSTENAALARRLLQLVKGNFAVETQVMMIRAQRLKKNVRYKVQVVPSQAAREALRDLCLLAPPEEGRRQLLRKSCCRRAFLRGVFLAGGSVNKPTGDYHLEIVVEAIELAQLVVHVMNLFGIKGRITQRKKTNVVYLKGGEAIKDYMAAIGSSSAIFAFEDARIIKEVRNNVNRQVNCETANLNKTVVAAMRQVAAIHYLAQTGALARLGTKLREAAELRMAHPDSSLNEIANLAGATLSKSCFNHRLRKLEMIAKEKGWEYK